MRAALVIALLALAAAEPLHGYSQFSLGGSSRLRWDSARVRWFASDAAAPGIPANEFQAVMARAFATWDAVPTASISFQFVGFTSNGPSEDDGLSVLGFEAHPEMERVLGATTFVIDTLTGELLEADVFFNSEFLWSTSAAGDPARFDLESVAVHEIGHFLGLGHSALGETEMAGDSRRVLASGAVMFPISLGRGSIADRALQPDDIAGVSDLYPDGDFRGRTGVLRGRVQRGGRGLLGAHVVAYSLRTRTLIGGFSLNEEGEFEIAGLEPGPHAIRVEPLDDADIESFFSSSAIDVNFQVTYHPRLFAAPAGGAGERVEIAVRPK